MTRQSLPTRLWDAFAATCLSLSGLAFWLAAGVTIADVLGRHLLKASVPAAIELSVLFIALGAMASLPACFSQRAHIEVNIIADIAGPLGRRALSLIGRLFSLAFAVALMAIFITFARQNFGGYRQLPDTGLSFFAAIGITAAFFTLASIGALRAVLAPPGEQHHG